MHQSLNEIILPVTVTLLGVMVVSLLLHMMLIRARRRENDLRVAKEAMLDHYSSVRAIIDDPALPLPALEFLCAFSHLMVDRTAAERLIKAIVANDDLSGKRSPTSEVLDKLMSTRPDLYDRFMKAIFSGVAYMMLRWPGHNADFVQIFARLPGDHKKEARAVRVVTSLSRVDGNGPLVGGNHAPA